MPPYQEIIDLLEDNYNPGLLWRDQWDLIKRMAGAIRDTETFLTNRRAFGDAIKEGLRKAYARHGLTAIQNIQINPIKEAAIKDIESFRTTPEYWANL